ncbi:hypothetical protein GF345_03905 [Candidatus Woesearchaeota archaeon]|nr:hypothetical protein [Candidatus Woesearchaeota archaeon]
MPKDDVYYIEIQNPVDFRKSVLEASRDLLRGLQKNEDLKKIRAKKAKEVSNLKSIIKEINTLVNQAKNLMPAASIKTAEAAKPKESKKKESSTGSKKGKKQEPEQKKSKPAEVNELEKQLKDIEEKLSSLG